MGKRVENYTREKGAYMYIGVRSFEVMIYNLCEGWWEVYS